MVLLGFCGLAYHQQTYDKLNDTPAQVAFSMLLNNVFIVEHLSVNTSHGVGT